MLFYYNIYRQQILVNYLVYYYSWWFIFQESLFFKNSLKPIINSILSSFDYTNNFVIELQFLEIKQAINNWGIWNAKRQINLIPIRFLLQAIIVPEIWWEDKIKFQLAWYQSRRKRTWFLLCKIASLMSLNKFHRI